MRPESYQATHEAADNLVAFHAALSNGNRAGEGIRCRCTRNPASPAVSKNMIRKLCIILRFSWIVELKTPGDTSMLIKSTKNLNKPVQDQRKPWLPSMLSPVQIRHLHFTTKVSCQH